MIVGLLSLTACGDQPPDRIRVGFVACLSGKHCDLGHGGRNGVTLAVEEFNAAGGVAFADGVRHLIELVNVDIHDDAAIEPALQKMAGQGVVAIIGPMLSQKAVKIKPLADRFKIPVISPTVSSHHLAAQQDYFFRVYPTCNTTAPALAGYVSNREHLKRIAIVTDPANKAFSEIWASHFNEAFTAHGGQIVAVHAKAEDESSSQLVSKLLKTEPDGILCVLNAYDTAMILQQVKLQNPGTRVFGTEWSTTESLDELSGEALDEAVFIASFDEDGRQPRFAAFEKSYQERFGRVATFGNRFGYEAMLVLQAALLKAKSPADLADALRHIGQVEALQGTIRLNEFGDVSRDVYIQKYSGGRFHVVERIPAQ